MIDIKELTHGFGVKELYKNINITISTTDKIGLVGLNGTGKTTFINILNGSLLPDKGLICVEKKLKIGYLDQFVTVDDNLSIYEYLETAFAELFEIEQQFNEINQKLAKDESCDSQFFLNKSGDLFEILCNKNFYEIPTKINQIASGLGITNLGLNNKMSKLSGGQKVKVMLAKLLLENPDFIILDEPTNYLDTVHIEWLKEYLKTFSGAFLIVSHDISFMNSVVNQIWAIENASIKRYSGNYNAYLKQKEAQNIALENKIESTQREAKNLQDYIAKNKARASTARMAKSREKRLEKLEILDKTKELPPAKFSFKYKLNTFNTLLIVEKLDVGYSNAVLKNLNFKCNNGEKIRISGFNGIGKSTLLKTICNKIEKLNGNITWADKVLIGYFEQELKFDSCLHTAIQEISDLFPKLSEKEIRSALAKTGLTAKHLAEPLSLLSGGEQCRVQLCKLTFLPYNFLIFDEPTNHLDIKAKKSLATAINAFPGTVIIVSHEQEFIDLITNLREIKLN